MHDHSAAHSLVCLYQYESERETHSDVAVGFYVIHPEASNTPCFAQKLLDGFQGKRTDKTINSERSSGRFRRWWNCKKVKEKAYIKNNDNY